MWAACLLVFALGGTPDGEAQPVASGQSPGRVALECGAGPSKRTSCSADVSAGVVLVGDAGEAHCELGRTWGFDAQGVWVADGCRGTFAFTDDRPTVVCAAAAGSRQVCEADTSKGVAPLSASPACVLGRTWGYDETGVWVADGCDATFVLTARRGLTCGSGSGGRERCDADSSAGVVLARTIGTAPCALGESWGYDAAGVWVDWGCKAEFVFGDTEAHRAEDRSLDAFFGQFEPYGRLLLHVAVYNDELQVQDNASWLGLKFSTRGPVKFFAATEWAVNLVRGPQFAQGATTSSGFLTLDLAQADQVFGARLGYVGVDFGPGGRIAIGKQWGVHFDVTGYTTEQFNVFGSEASATFTGGSDGGFLGSGRADEALSYRNTIFEILDIGGQMQFRTALNDQIIDGAGLSAQVTVVPGLRVGATYTKDFFDDEIVSSVRGLGGDAELAAVGARVEWKMVEAGLVYARHRNGDVVHVPIPALTRSRSRTGNHRLRRARRRAVHARQLPALCVAGRVQ